LMQHRWRGTAPLFDFHDQDDMDNAAVQDLDCKAYVGDIDEE